MTQRYANGAREARGPLVPSRSNPQIANNLMQGKESTMENNGVGWEIMARILEKKEKLLRTGTLFIFTLKIEGEHFPTQWSTFKGELYAQVKEREMWRVRVSTSENANDPANPYKNVLAFLEQIPESFASDRRDDDGAQSLEIPNEDGAIGTSHSTEVSSWLAERLEKLPADRIGSEMQTCLNDAMEIVKAQMARSESYTVQEAMYDCLEGARLFSRYVFDHPRDDLSAPIQIPGRWAHEVRSE